MSDKYILIGGDTVPTESNLEMFVNGDINKLAGNDLKEILDSASFRIFNLEVPLTDTETPIFKHGPDLIAPVSSVKGYKSLGADLLILANNHILDQGVQGLNSTIKALKEENISYVGAGDDLKSASDAFVFEFASKIIGVYACCEHEFSTAGENSAGANPFDPLFSLDHIRELKERVDYVIVMYHGGKEHYRYPSPVLQKICRRIADKGADLIVCQHSHCIGCEEKYNGSTIVYGQGNFIFDLSDNECWQTGLVIKLCDDFSVSYLPVVKRANVVRIADSDEKKKILSEFEKRSEELLSAGFIERKYAEFAENNLYNYLTSLSGNRSLIFRIINRLTKGAWKKIYLRSRYMPKDIVRIINHIDCEAHRELMLRGLSGILDEKSD